jgi:insertion element IS1 protein InsB
VPYNCYAAIRFGDYGDIFPADQHRQGKAHTFTIESKNNQLRGYLARLRRKTHCYSKSLANLRYSILFVFARKLGQTLRPQSNHPPIRCRVLWVGEVSIPI